MALDTKYRKFPGRMVIIGFGSIGQGVLPLILRHIDLTPSQITIVTAAERGRHEAEDLGVRFLVERLTEENYFAVLDPLLKPGDFLLNVSVEVSSVALIELCRGKGALYLDTCVEPWPGGYTDRRLLPSARTNYALREHALALRKAGPGGPTAVLTHGANPGLVSHFVKAALLNIAEAVGAVAAPQSRAEWAALAAQLGVKVIHIAERDTQVSSFPKKPGEFVNTWSIDGFVAEGMQPAELGWGSHERHFPPDGGRHDYGCGAAIYLSRPGASTQVRSWTPVEGPYHGFLITHSEAISIADYLTVHDNDLVRYRPTVHYAYHPCDDAVLSLHEFAGKNWRQQKIQRLVMDEIIAGTDELGVLLMGHAKGAYWYGSRLSIAQARGLVRYNNATSLQVTASALAGMIWALENPAAGIVEPDELDHRRILDICRPYLGELLGSLQRLDAALRSRKPVRRGARSARPVAVQEFPRGLRIQTSSENILPLSTRISTVSSARPVQGPSMQAPSSGRNTAPWVPHMRYLPRLSKKPVLGPIERRAGMRAVVVIAEQGAAPANDEDREPPRIFAENEAASLALGDLGLVAEKARRHPFTPAILQISFHSSAVTGDTDSRDWRSSAMFFSVPSALIAASVTGVFAAATGFTLTMTKRPVVSLGSG